MYNERLCTKKLLKCFNNTYFRFLDFLLVLVKTVFSGFEDKYTCEFKIVKVPFTNCFFRTSKNKFKHLLTKK